MHLFSNLLSMILDIYNHLLNKFIKISGVGTIYVIEDGFANQKKSTIVINSVVIISKKLST